MTNSEMYKQVKSLLSQVDVTCCGYTEAGKDVTIYNNVAQLTIRNNKASEVSKQLSAFINKWVV